MFPLEKILFALASDAKSTKYVLQNIKPKVRFDFASYNRSIHQLSLCRLKKSRIRNQS